MIITAVRRAGGTACDVASEEDNTHAPRGLATYGEAFFVCGVSIDGFFKT